MFESEQADELLFGIQRSIRYHDRRVAHFDVLHKLTSVLTILLSGIVIMDVLGKDAPLWIKSVAAAAAVLGACDLVVGYSHRANQHRDLKRRFCSLEVRLHKATTAHDIEEINADRVLIEADEPPIFRALDAQCHNELLIAKGYSRAEYPTQFHDPGWFQRLTANWFRWSNTSTTAS